jgi:hypothetical protein
VTTSVKTPAKNWHLARRDLLRHLGVGAACLPLLHGRRVHAQDKFLMVLQMSEGYRQQYWKPATGPLGALTPTLAPFEPHKAELAVMPDMSNPGINTGGHSSYGVIYYGKGATGGGYKEPGGPTFDQVAAAGLPALGAGRKSLHTWVQLHLPPLPTTSLGGTRCFWSGAGQPARRWARRIAGRWSHTSRPFASWRRSCSRRPAAAVAPAAGPRPT